MPRFPSQEWMDEFCTRVAEQPDAGRLAGALDGIYRFVIEPSGPVAERHAYDVEIRPDGDGGARVRRLEAAAERPRLTLTATYPRWKELVTGRLDVGMAVMLRRLRVAGDLSRLLRDVGSARALTAALGQVDSEWPDEGTPGSV